MQKRILMLLIFGFSLLGGAGSVSAQQWVDDHNSCPQTYNSQTCTGSSLACGYTTSDGTLYCEEPTTVNATLPSNTTTDTAAYNGNALGGGFVVDCLKNASTCTPWECQRDSSCNDINVKTTCTGAGTFTCSTVTQDSQTNCSGGYRDCDGSDVNGCEIDIDGSAGTQVTYTNACTGTAGTTACTDSYLDCNGNGTGVDGACEIQKNTTAFPGAPDANVLYGDSCNSASAVCGGGYTSCTGVDAVGDPFTDGCSIEVGVTTCNGGTGTYNDSCGCDAFSASYFETGTLSQYSTNDPLLRGQQDGTGDLVNFANSSTSDVFVIENTGGIKIGTSSSTNAGTIQWTGSDFQGYTGSAWASLTSGTGGTGNTLDQAYDEGGVGAGAEITATDGPVTITVPDGTTTDAFRVNDATGDTTPFIIDDEGNVGIGTGSPETTLDVSGVTQLKRGSADAQITGSIDPDGTTTVTGVGTDFLNELAVGDQLRLFTETRVITAINSATELIVDTAFSNSANDTSPQRIGSSLYVTNANDDTNLLISENGAVGIGNRFNGTQLGVGGLMTTLSAGTVTVSNGSTTVTTSSDLTSTLQTGDSIQVQNTAPVEASIYTVAGISWSGSLTTIVLDNNYRGTTDTDGSVAIVKNPTIIQGQDNGGSVKFHVDSLGVTTKGLNIGSYNDAQSNFIDPLYATFAFGTTSKALGQNAVAMGSSAEATNSGAFAFGNNSTASGMFTFALGGASVSGNQSFGWGDTNTVSGYHSLGLGSYSTIAADNATAIGTGLLSESYNGIVLGAYNVDGTHTANSWVLTDPLLEIGNGTGSGANRSNAMTILKNGNVGIGTATPSEILEIKALVNGDRLALSGLGSNPPDAIGISFKESSTSFPAFDLYLDAADNQLVLQRLRWNNETDLLDALVVDRRSGRVGIGNSAPDGQLTVQQSSALNIASADVLIGSLDTVAATAHGLNVGDFVTLPDAGGWATREVATSDTNSFTLTADAPEAFSDTEIYATDASKDLFQINQADGSRKFTVDSSGKVGIGTPTPTAALEIQSDSEDDNRFAQESSFMYTELAQESWSSSGGLLFNAYRVDDDHEDHTDGSLFYTGNTKYKKNNGSNYRGAAAIGVKLNNTDVNTGHGGRTFILSAPPAGETSDELIEWTSVAEFDRYRSFFDGNVGIGDNSSDPGAYLDINTANGDLTEGTVTVTSGNTVVQSTEDLTSLLAPGDKIIISNSDPSESAEYTIDTIRYNHAGDPADTTKMVLATLYAGTTDSDGTVSIKQVTPGLKITSSNTGTPLVLSPMTEPVSAQEGGIYYDSTSDALKFHNGSAWTTLESGGGNNLNQTYNASASGSKNITADDGAIGITVPDESNNAALILTQNNDTHDPYALSIDQNANAIALNITGGKDGAIIAHFARDDGALAGVADGSLSVSVLGADPQIHFDTEDATPANGTVWAVGVDDGDSDQFKITYNTGDQTNELQNNSTALTIDGSGNVGIGTASPAAELDIKGSAIDTALSAGTVTVTNGSATVNVTTDITGALSVGEVIKITNSTPSETSTYTVDAVTASVVTLNAVYSGTTDSDGSVSLTTADPIFQVQNESGTSKISVNGEGIATYDFGPTFTEDNQIINKKYVDDNISTGGGPRSGSGIGEIIIADVGDTTTSEAGFWWDVTTNILYLPNSSNSAGVGLKADQSLGANVTLTLPTTDGDANQVLTSDGSGVLSWSDAGSHTSRTVVDDSNTTEVNPAGGVDDGDEYFEITLSTEYYVGVDTDNAALDTANADAPIHIKLPSATGNEGQTFVVKDEGGEGAQDSTTHPIYIIPNNGTDTIDGRTAADFTTDFSTPGQYYPVNYSSYTLISDGAGNWFHY